MKALDIQYREQRTRVTGTASSEMADAPMSKSQRLIHRVLCLLLFSLIFEGVARKLAPAGIKILIFFSKDLLTILLLLLALKSHANAEAARLLRTMGLLVLLLLPCIASTAFHDPVLALFGMKQYALFATVSVAMCLAYIPNNVRELFSLFRFVAFSVVVTTGFAVAQNRLPSSNWINLSTTGDELDAFSAGGYLRVSATFPFVGQYCYYLNAMCFSLAAYFYLGSILRGRKAAIQTLVLSGFFIIGSFVTGSRGSVIGNAGILGAAGLFCVVFSGGKALIKVIALAMLGFMLIGFMQGQYPQLFAAYQARVDGTNEKSHAIEVEKRIVDGLIGWTRGALSGPPSLLGNGLGVMSNGSDKLSAYAAGWRRSGFWTETDQATTYFEGGWYLMFVWYGFRFWVIMHCFGLVRKIRRLQLQYAGCFALGFILVNGVTGTLAIQPPLAIWWWLAVGLVVCLKGLDGERLAERISPSA